MNGRLATPFPRISVAFYTTDDCTYSPEKGDGFAKSNSPGPCDTSSNGKPWLSFTVSSPGNSKN